MNKFFVQYSVSAFFYGTIEYDVGMIQSVSIDAGPMVRTVPFALLCTRGQAAGCWRDDSLVF